MLDSHKLNRIYTVVGRPSYCKEAADQSQVRCTERGYADPFTRQYPCHTKVATFCSAMEAEELDAPSEIKAEISKFAAFWAITEDVEAARSALANSKKQASIDELSDSDFALVQMAGEAKVRKYAAFDRQSVVESAIAFHDNRHKYPLAWRKEAAIQLLSRADKHDAVLPTYVDQYLNKAAGFGLATEEAIDSALISRINRAPKTASEDTEKLIEIMSSVAENPDLCYDGETVQDMLSCMDAYDRHHKLAQYYGSDVELPEEVLVNTEPELAKIAGCGDRVVRLVNGTSVDVHHLTADVLNAVDEKLAAMSQEKLAAVLPTLPKPDADLLVELCSTQAKS